MYIIYFRNTRIIIIILLVKNGQISVINNTLKFSNLIEYYTMVFLG